MGVEVCNDIIREGVDEMRPLVGNDTVMTPLHTQFMQGFPERRTGKTMAAGSKPRLKQHMYGQCLEVCRNAARFRWRGEDDVVDTEKA